MGGNWRTLFSLGLARAANGVQKRLPEFSCQTEMAKDISRSCFNLSKERHK